MKQKLMVWWLCVLLAAGLFSGCGMTDAASSSANKQPGVNAASIMAQNRAGDECVVRLPTGDKADIFTGWDTGRPMTAAA